MKYVKIIYTSLIYPQKMAISPINPKIISSFIGNRRIWYAAVYEAK